MKLLIAGLALLPLPDRVVTAAPSEPLSLQAEDRKAEYEAKRAEAGEDVEKLWDVYLWCEAFGMEKEGRSCLRAILKVDDGHREAHEKLGHIEYDGQWFTSKAKLERYKKDEAKRKAEEEGLARFNDEWVPAEDLPFLERGLVRNDDGEWVSKEDHEKQQAGWIRQDLVWISPDEKANLDKGLWKCGEEWKTLAEANEYHSKLGQWWVIPTDYFTLYTTLDREAAMEAVDHMDRAYRDLNRLLGGSPPGRVPVTMLRSAEQYGRFAAGGNGVPQVESRGLSSLHYAFLADLWFDWTDQALPYLGGGVGYWDKDADNGDAWGRHSARHAAALSLVEAADPSTRAVEKTRKSKLQGFKPDEFWAEKRFPEWFRFGLASYADRYFIDQFVAQGGEAEWARKWSVENLLAKGGLRPIQDLFKARLDLNKFDDSAKLLNEFGLLVAFAIDGKNPEVAAAYGAVKGALRGDDPRALATAMKALQDAIIANEKALLEFAGI